MPSVSIVWDYLFWHYSAAYADIFWIWRNMFWTVNHVFSVPELLKSLFAPFKRIQEEQVNIIKSPSDFFANLFVNFMMRIVGLIIRTFFLSLALFLFLVVIGFSLLVLALWTILPALVAYLFVAGLYTIL